MPISTFTQPDRTTQSGSAYPANIDGAISVLARSGAAFAPHEQSTPNMTVRVDAGFIYHSTDALGVIAVAAQSTATIVAPTTNPRIDRVVVDVKTGAVSIITGVEAASPSPVYIPEGKYPICQIALTPSTTAITNSMLTDERLGIGAFLAMREMRRLAVRSALSNQIRLTPAVSKNVGLLSITYNPSNLVLVAVGNADGTDAYILFGTALNGISLTEATNPRNVSLFDVVFSNGTYIAVGNPDGTDAYVITSTNASSWTERSNPRNFVLYAVAANGATVVAGGGSDGTDAYLIRSTDTGATWSEIANTAGAEIRDLIYSSAHTAWIGVGNIAGAIFITRSTDNGASFSSVGSLPAIGSLGLVARVPANNYLIATKGTVPSSSYVLSTDGGVTWVQKSLPASLEIYNIKPAGDGLLLSCAYTSYYTEDGVAFFPVPNLSASAMTDLVHVADNANNSIYMVGSADGTNPFFYKTDSIAPMLI